jgi:predicted anti-sigma-YlaC factor YlaD
MQDLIDDAPGLTLCEAVQIALEMDARGALAPAKQARLETHIASCEACRAFREVRARTEASLRDVLVREAGPGTEAHAAAVVARMRRLRRRGLVFIPVITAVTVGGLLLGDWVENGAIRHAPEMCAVAALCLVPGLALFYWRRRRLGALLEGDDVVATHRRLLRDALRVQTFGIGLWAACVVWPFVLDAIDPSVWRDPIARVALPVCGVLGLVALIAGVMRRAGLRRQLDRMR